MKYPLLDWFQDPFTRREEGERVRRERLLAVGQLRSSWLLRMENIPGAGR